MLPVLAVAACGPARAYRGPARPRAETAVLSIRGTGHDVGMAGDTRYMVSLRKLDGRPWRGIKSIVSVLPGPHTVELRWHKMKVPYWPGDDLHADRQHWVPIAGGTAIYEIDAEAGVSYELVWPDDGPDAPAGPPLGFEPIVR